MLIKGTVEKVVFRNAENGYSVLTVSDSVISITAVGVVPPISEGEVVEIGRASCRERVLDRV